MMNRVNTIVSTYKRSQLEWALWQAFFQRAQKKAPDKIHPVFRTRIKRLIDLDGKLVKSETHRQHAFVSDTNVGNGNDRHFSLFDVFYLGLGLDFLDAGYNQLDVIFILQHLRPHMEAEIQNIFTYPKFGRNVFAPEDVPQAPIYTRGNSVQADLRTFLVIQKVEFKEVYGFDEKSKTPIIYEPRIFKGYTSLTDFLDQDTYRQQKHLVIEIARLATEIREFLKESPVVKRGRKANDKE